MEPESLTPEIARRLAQDSVAALKPGDVLAVRVAPTNARELHHLALYGQKIEADTGVKVAFIPGEEFAHTVLNVTVNVTAETPEQIAEAVRAEIGRQVRAARNAPTHVSVLGV
jgi:hypothetical protein